MYIVIDGFDRTLSVPSDSIRLSLACGDTNNKLDFQVVDTGALIPLDTMQEVIVWNETATDGVTSSVLSVPSINMLVYPTFGSGSQGWTTSGSLSGLVTFGLFQVSETFSNSTNGGQGLVQQSSQYGYVHPGQKYMFSAYVTGVSPVSIQSVLKMEFLDGAGTVLSGTVQDVRTPPTTQTRVAISGTAPATAVLIRISAGGQTTSGTNSGIVRIASLQLEPMWFTAEGVSYPTPDNNINFAATQLSTRVMPDGTCSRYNRIFSGYIEDVQAQYDGPNRIWTVSCAYADAILDSSGNNGSNSQINASYSGQYDKDMLNELVATYFGNSLTSIDDSGSTMTLGKQFSQVSYNDMSLKDILNSIVDVTGYTYFVSACYALYYRPYYYAPAAFAFTNAAPDSVTTFTLYEYSYEKDATQRKRQVKVIGSKYIAPAITDTFTGNGSTKTFGPFTQQPLDVKYVQVNGVNQLAGVAGRNTFSQGYAVLVDKTNAQMTFNVAPGNTLSVTINYTFEAPVSVTVLGQDAEQPALAPVYVSPTFVQKVNDTSIGDLATAIDRGLAELTKASNARIILSFKAQKFVSPGSLVYITASLDGITNQPFVVQAVDAIVLGNGIGEYNYTVGAYNPTVIDHLRQHHRAIAASTTTAGVTTPQRIDLVFNDVLTYSETLTFTSVASNVSVYGTGTYGTNTYS